MVEELKIKVTLDTAEARKKLDELGRDRRGEKTARDKEGESARKDRRTVDLRELRQRRDQERQRAKKGRARAGIGTVLGVAAAAVAAAEVQADVVPTIAEEIKKQLADSGITDAATLVRDLAFAASDQTIRRISAIKAAPQALNSLRNTAAAFSLLGQELPPDLGEFLFDLQSQNVQVQRRLGRNLMAQQFGNLVEFGRQATTIVGKGAWQVATGR